MLISDVLAEKKTDICQAANTSDISIDNNIGICQAANTSDISIENKTCICQGANTSISVFFSVLISDVLAP
jgi:hypothetical protein